MLCLTASGQNETKNPVYQLWNNHDQIYASCDRGLLRLSPDGADSLIIESSNDRVMSLYEKDKTLLAGTYNGIIHTFQNGIYRKITLPLRKNGAPYLVNSVIESKGIWWASTLEGVVFEINQADFSWKKIAFIDSKTKAQKNILELAKDNNENLWVLGVSNVHFIQERKKGRKKKHFFLASGNYNDSVFDLVSSSKGTFSFSTLSQTISLHMGSFTPTLMDASKNEVELPKSIDYSKELNYCISEGSLWIFNDNYIYKLLNRRWDAYKIDLKENGGIQSFCVDDSRVWVVIDNEIHHFNYSKKD